MDQEPNKSVSASPPLLSWLPGRLNISPVDLACWVLLPAGALILMFWLRAGLMTICFYALFSILVISRIMMEVWLRPLTCSRTLDRDLIEAGESIHVTLEIQNPAPWPILWLYAEESLPENTPVDGTHRRLLFLPPRRSFHLNYSIRLPHRGCYQLGPVLLESGDVFGLFKRCQVDHARSHVTVLPSYDVIEPLDPAGRSRLGDQTTRRSIFDDPTRIRGIREYRRGDPLKFIHWKSSAHTGRLVSRVCEPVVEAGATLVLDFHQDAWKQSISLDKPVAPDEQAVEICTSVAHYLAQGRWKVGLFSNGRDPLGLPGFSMNQALSSDSFGEAMTAARRKKPDERLKPISIRASRSRDQFLLIRENLGRITLSDGLEINELIFDELPYIEREQVLVWMTGRLDAATEQALFRIRQQGYRIMFFMICNNPDHDRAFDILIPHGIEVYRMDEDWRLREIATGRRTV
jgi:uncharacterized protein (DUF58 family)